MTANSKTTKSTSKTGAARRLTGIAMLSAVAFALQFLEFPIPIMPAFIKLDFSDLPELLAAFAYGPLAGVAVAAIKNLIHLPLSSSMYVGELSNFLLGAVLSVAARRRGRGAIPPSIPPVTARRAADQKTRSPAASSAARQTMPAAGRAAGKTRTRKTIRTGSTRQPARASVCARRKAPRSKALPGGKCAKSAR